jgi:hypothetical protein
VLLDALVKILSPSNESLYPIHSLASSFTCIPWCMLYLPSLFAKLVDRFKT